MSSPSTELDEIEGFGEKEFVPTINKTNSKTGIYLKAKHNQIISLKFLMNIRSDIHTQSKNFTINIYDNKHSRGIITCDNKD